MSVLNIQSLFVSHQERLQRFLRRRGTSADMAADFTQDVFVRLLSGAPVSEIENASAYLFRAARNAAINHERRQRILSFVDDPETALGELADEAPSPERIVLSRQELTIIQAVLDELPSVQREVFILSRIEGCTFAQIGARLGIPSKTAYGHMTRILVRMKLRLDGIGV